MAVVPGQHVRDRDVHARREASPHHLVQVREGRGGRNALDDVVDASLDDERIGAGERVVEPRGDLIGPLAVDPWLRTRMPGFARSAQ